MTLCSDVEHGADHSGANAIAANVGNRSANTKAVEIEGTRIHCQSLDAAAEQNSENCVKIMLMLEY
jgi:hypothetical protein